MIAAAILAALAAGPLSALSLADAVRVADRAQVAVEADRLVRAGILVESWDVRRGSGYQRLLAVRGSR